MCTRSKYTPSFVYVSAVGYKVQMRYNLNKTQHAPVEEYCELTVSVDLLSILSELTYVSFLTHTFSWPQFNAPTKWVCTFGPLALNQTKILTSVQRFLSSNVCYVFLSDLFAKIVLIMFDKNLSLLHVCNWLDCEICFGIAKNNNKWYTTRASTNWNMIENFYHFNDSWLRNNCKIFHLKPKVSSSLTCWQNGGTVRGWLNFDHFDNIKSIRMKTVSSCIKKMHRCTMTRRDLFIYF